MKEQEKTKEQIQKEDDIFSTFSKWINSTHPAETKRYCDQFCKDIYDWYKKYHNKAYMFEEITIVINKLTNKDKKLNLPKDKEGFFKYFYRALKNEKINSHRKFDENKSINIPKDVKSKLKKLNKIIASEENKLGRKLTEEEKIRCATTKTKLFKKQVYMNILKVIKIGGIHLSKEDDSKIDLHDNYLSKNNIIKLKETVKYVLAKKQKRARDCCKALFTLYCIKKDIRELYPILDQKILDSFHKEGKKWKQYEIYLKYHPKVTKKSAEVQASTNLHMLLTDIKTRQKEKNK